jgi:AraC family transcriptional regulator of adaptative response/methylated-DNA-[protein]-cysteine methyltransferase
MSATLSYSTHESSIGTLLLVASARGLRLLTLLKDSETGAERLTEVFGNEQPTLMPGFLASTTQAIDAYLAQGTPLKLPVDLAGGTALQRMVWLAIAKIPYGQTVSYSELAERIGFPRAVRAVASACGANPVPLAIPCHRIIAKDGSLGGFSLGGLEVKEKLLAVESAKHVVAAA